MSKDNDSKSAALLESKSSKKQRKFLVELSEALSKKGEKLIAYTAPINKLMKDPKGVLEDDVTTLSELLKSREKVGKDTDKMIRSLENDKTDNKRIAFSLSYDGEGTLYEKHQIRADDLAKIIGSMNNLILKSDQILHGKETTEPLITVTAPVKKGSVIIEFLVSGAVIETLKFIGLSAAGGIIGGTAFELVKRIGNKAPKVIKVNRKKKTTTIEIDEKQSMEVPTEVVKILKNTSIRENLNEIVYEPTKGQKAMVKIKDSEDEVIQAITADDTKNYKFIESPDKDPEKPVYEKKMIRFIRINFENENDWTFQFANDNKIHSVKIGDNVFLSKIQNATESFDANKLFEVKMEIINQKTSANRTKTTYTIEKVIKSYG